MADRILTWHIAGGLGQQAPPKVDVGPAYYMDADYRPVLVWLRVKGDAPSGAGVIIDINDDGVSIFTNRPTLLDGQTSRATTTFAAFPAVIEEDSIVTLDLDSVSTSKPGSDLSIELHLERTSA